MKFHFWGQVPRFALSIVVNVNCPAPTVSLNGRQCLLSRENCRDVVSAWLEAVRQHCFLLIPTLPLWSVFPFSAVSHFQCSRIVMKCWLLHLARLFVFLGCSAELAFLWLMVWKGWEGRRMRAGGRVWNCWTDSYGAGCGRFLPLPLEVDVRSPGHKNYSKSKIQEACAVLFPTVSQGLAHSGCRINTSWMTVMASCLSLPA